MSSGFASSLSRDAGRHGSPREGAGRRVMSEKEIKAYLATRDALRRIKRMSPLFVPERGGHQEHSRARRKCFRLFVSPAPTSGSPFSDLNQIGRGPNFCPPTY